VGEIKGYLSAEEMQEMQKMQMMNRRRESGVEKLSA
jgi:hypothetical protein